MVKLVDRLMFMNSHSALYLMRASVSIPRLIYCLRCAPSWRSANALINYDDNLKLSLEKILNCSLSNRAWDQISLPISQGGLGIRHAVHSAIPCFLASVYSCNDLIQKII